MTERYCPKCATEVEDVGGFCLLGHDLRLKAVTETTSMDDLRAEVDRAFEEARVQVAAVTGEIPLVDASAPPPPPPLPDDLEEQTKTRMVEAWKDFEDEPSGSSASDPITAFAPNSRMDWGPGETKLKKRRFRR